MFNIEQRIENIERLQIENMRLLNRLWSVLGLADEVVEIPRRDSVRRREALQRRQKLRQ